MIISEITIIDKKKKKITLEDSTQFSLYNSEIRNLQLEEGMELSEEVYREIQNTILVKRAKARVLYLLRDSDKTEYQLREKLRAGFYPLEVIDNAINYAKSYDYINDHRYAVQYLECKGKKMSRRQLSVKLAEKGIPEEIRKEIFNKGENDELEVLEKLIRKKNIDFPALSRDERKKIYAHFMRKGFTFENILKKINEFESQDHLT